jgi:hypothetical protein
MVDNSVINTMNISIYANILIGCVLDTETLLEFDPQTYTARHSFRKKAKVIPVTATGSKNSLLRQTWIVGVRTSTKTAAWPIAKNARIR